MNTKSVGVPPRRLLVLQALLYYLQPLFGAGVGLLAVLRSRHTKYLALQQMLPMAALRGTCRYPSRAPQFITPNTISLLH